MTFTHDDIRKRLVEFLYGELEGETRAAFEAHVAGCASCRSEVAGFQKTRDVARAAVRVGLEEPVPAGVRTRILEAAAAGKVPVGTSSGNAKAAAGVAVPKRSSGSANSEARGPFAWLRARWTVPMFVTVAAMGALLLVRETIYREARQPMGETPAPATTTPPMGPAAESAAPAARAAAEAAPADEKAEEAPREEGENRPKTERRRALTVDGLAGGRPSARAEHLAPTAKAAKGKAAAAPVKANGARAKKANDNDGVDGLLSGVESPRPAKREVNDAFGAVASDKAEGRGFAQPPPPPVAPRAPAPSAAPAPAASSVIMDDERPQVMQRQEKMGAFEENADRAEEMAASSAGAAPVSRGVDRDGERAPDAAAPLVARAEKLMASRQWAEAAAAYRQLIARFPKHEQVPNWRRRLAVVEAAAARGASPAK